MTTIAVGNRRLLRLVKILDTADALHKKNGEPTYDQDRIRHPCGAPACAWGHYKAATPKKSSLSHWFFGSNGAQGEFGMNDEEVEEVFDAKGCGDAQTAKAAAKYIRAFVKRRQTASKRK